MRQWRARRLRRHLPIRCRQPRATAMIRPDRRATTASTTWTRGTKYDGPWPVVAIRRVPMGELLVRRPGVGSGGESTHRNDGGCFRAALDAVRRWGGASTAGSRAWAWHHIDRPEPSGGWTAADFCGGWTCMVDQGHYGHRAAKPSMLYAVAANLPSLRWGRSSPPPVSRRAKERGEGNCMYLSRRQRAATPEPFRDLLLDMARSVKQ